MEQQSLVERDLPDREGWRDEVRDALKDAQTDAIVELLERAYNCGFEQAQETMSKWHKP